jgi:hypothetical protein
VLSDFINDGIVELNQAKPIETRLEITDVVNLEGLPLNYVYRVDLWATDGYGQETIPPTNEAVRWQSGWSYWAHELTFSQATRRVIDQGFTDGKLAVIVWGYSDRDPLTAVDDVFENKLSYVFFFNFLISAVGVCKHNPVYTNPVYTNPTIHSHTE